jgi:hypothetical protein
MRKARLQKQLRQVSSRSFARYGVENLAYVKRAMVKGHAVYAIHAADGTYLWQYAEQEVARAALQQQDMEPLSVH